MRVATPLALLAFVPVLLAVAAEPSAPRIVSLSPSLTAMLVSLGARSTLVGVDEYSSRQQPEVAELPTVGGLFTPSIEAVVALEPDVVVLVLQRAPLYLVGRGSYLHAMLSAAGADNPAAVFSDPYPRVALEWLIAAAPEVILDASDDPEDAASYWSRWPSLPAVAAGRVVAVPASEVTLPGPRPDRALRILSQALYGGEPAP